MWHVIELVDLLVMRVEHLLESCRQILQEVKPVSDLGRIGSPLPNAGSIGFGSVTGDNLDVGMVLEPGGNGFGRSILK